MSHKKTQEEFKKEVEDGTNGEYTLLGEYVNNRTKVLIRHNCEKCNNNEYEVRPTDFTRGNRCPSCSKSRAMPKKDKPTKEVKPKVVRPKQPKEVKPKTAKIGNAKPAAVSKSNISCYNEDIYNYITSIDEKLLVAKDDNTLVENDTIGIYVPDKHIAIDYENLIDHSESIYGKKYHLTKTELLEEKDIRLIHVYEDEWRDKSEIIKSKLLNLLKLANDLPKIYARKCIIKEVKPSDKNAFLDANHVQGKDQSNIKLGLYHEGKLVSVMTFCKPRKSLGQSKDKTTYDYELSRFASDINLHVVGAFSKLFKYFERNYEWNRLITYADKRWSNGNVYLTNGWINTHDSKPNYWYSSGDGCRIHRYTFRKTALPEKFPELFDPSKTEFQIMDEAGYVRVWDCGNMVFEYTRD